MRTNFRATGDYKTTFTNQVIPLWTSFIYEDGAISFQYGPWVMMPPDYFEGKDGGGRHTTEMESGKVSDHE